jgi:predicted phage terminase large subunit-like protein
MPLPSRAECERALARINHYEFIQHTWQRPDPYIEAKENPFQRDACSRIDEAIRKYRRGQSSFICFTIPFGSGKSDISSRYLPPHFLGEFPDAECLVVSHTDNKATEFGAFGRTLMQSPEYRELYPRVELSRSRHGVEEWGIDGHFGKAQYIGIGSGTAGKRGNLIVVDDFFGKREHAESETHREKVWQSFTDDIMTRRAPVTIVIMVVTPWHVDDPIGRIKKKMAADPNFPRFEFITYPAESPKYKSGWLFPERFSKEWYVSQKTILGNYGYQSLMQCDPIIKGGNFLRTDKIHIVDRSGRCETCGGVHEWPENLRRKRGWDLASSEKQTQKDDPDFTAGVLGGVVYVPSAMERIKIPILYVEDVVRGQWEAFQRQQIIRNTAIADGAVEVGIEAFGAYKDAFTEMHDCLKGIRSVRKMQLPGDKQIKAGPLVPIFEAGNVYFRKAPWNDPFIKVLSDFPSGAHDDDVDALAVMFAMFTLGRVSFESV